MSNRILFSSSQGTSSRKCLGLSVRILVTDDLIEPFDGAFFVVQKLVGVGIARKQPETPGVDFKRRLFGVHCLLIAFFFVVILFFNGG